MTSYSDGSVRELVNYLFAREDPMPSQLEEYRRALPDEYLSLANLFLCIRLMLQWSDFGVSHANVRIVEGASAEALTLEIRVYDPVGMRSLIQHGLEGAGFLNIGYYDERFGGIGGWITATAPPQLVERLQS